MLLRETFTNQLHIYNAKLYQMRANASKKSKCRRLHICRLSMCLYIFLINFEPFSNQRHKLKEKPVFSLCARFIIFRIIIYRRNNFHFSNLNFRDDIARSKHCDIFMEIICLCSGGTAVGKIK